ncbi:MAG TPA: hypothetical protein VKA05_06160 [Acidimicrobiales bacterium]|nr:hypothetical protein [Acidimicrobiales bacterium]
MAPAPTTHDARSGRRRRRSVVPGLLVAPLLVGVLSTAGPAVAAQTAAPASARLACTYGFNTPDAAAIDGSDLFVANKGGNSVTELSPTSGACIGNVTGSQFHFDSPAALKALGANLFVANQKGNTVTEVAVATRALVRVISASACKFSDPVALATNGTTYLFVLNGTGSVTRVDTSTGACSGIASGSSLEFKSPTAIISVGTDLFVTNYSGNTVTEINSSSMTLVRILSGSQYAFNAPTAIAGHGADIWITNKAGQSVTELLASTGGAVQVVPNTSDYLPTPGPITYGDGYLFAASPPGGSPMITQIVPTDPATLPWMMCNTNYNFFFSNPQAMAVYGANLWVVNEGGAGGPAGNSVTEMNADTGILVKVVR